MLHCCLSYLSVEGENNSIPLSTRFVFHFLRMLLNFSPFLLKLRTQLITSVIDSRVANMRGSPNSNPNGHIASECPQVISQFSAEAGATRRLKSSPG